MSSSRVVSLIARREILTRLKIEAQADALGLDASITEYDDEAAAREAVETGQIDAAVIDAESVLVDESLDEALGAAINGAVNGLALAQRLADEGLDPTILQPVLLDMTALQPAADEAGEKALVAFVSILLAAVKPWQLLAGKIIGLGVLALSQLVIISAAGLGVAIAFDILTVPGAAIATVVQVLGWFLLGFTLVAALFAVCGALVSRQGDLQSVLLPMTLILVAALVLAITAGQNPDGSLARVTSFVPALSTMVMPVRVATGSVAWWEIALAIALMLVAIVVVVRVGGRIYAGALLGKGGRVKVKDALAAERVS